MNSLKQALSITCTTATLLACSGAPEALDERTGELGQDFSYTPSERWRLGKPISVCFMSGASSSEALSVRLAVERTWARVASLPFTGWDACSNYLIPGTNPRQYDADIRIGWTETGGMNSEAGNRSRLDLTNPSMVLRMFRGAAPPGDAFSVCYNDAPYVGQSSYRWPSGRARCLDIVAIHEFGHAVGNHHEHVRSDTPSSCTEPVGGDPGATTFFGAWDPVSVDNYCNPLEANDGLLSSHDIAGAQFLYPKTATNFIYSMYGDVARLTGDPTYRGLVFNTHIPSPRPNDANRPFTGDFDGDGSDDIFFYRTGTAEDRVWYGSSAPNQFTISNNEDVDGTFIPVVGKFDATRGADIYWYHPTSTDYIWYGRSGRSFDDSKTAKSFSRSGTFIPLSGDFDGNGFDDIFWYQPGSGADYIWWNSSTGFSEVTTEVSGNYEPFVGDFDCNNWADIFWYAPGSGVDYIWWGTPDRTFAKLDAPSNVSGTYTPIVGDFDGNCSDDIIWNVGGSSASSANDYLWLGRPLARTFVETTFAILGDAVPLVGDFDGTNKDDLFLYRP